MSFEGIDEDRADADARDELARNPISLETDSEMDDDSRDDDKPGSLWNIVTQVCVSTLRGCDGI